jgi:hypothetical protein
LIFCIDRGFWGDLFSLKNEFGAHGEVARKAKAFRKCNEARTVCSSFFKEKNPPKARRLKQISNLNSI